MTPQPATHPQPLPVLLVEHRLDDADAAALLADLGAGPDAVQLSGNDLEAWAADLLMRPDTELIVDTRPSWGRRQFLAWKRLHRHLAPGGRWVALRSIDEARGRREVLVERIGEREQLSVDVEPLRLVVRDQRTPFAVLHHASAGQVLAAREPDVASEVLASEPGGVLELPRAERHHPHEPEAGPLPTSLPYPELQVRHYAGNIVLAPGPLALAGRSVLPDSFRWHLADNRGNGKMRDSNAEFGYLATPVPAAADLPLLPGTYFLLDYHHPGHYGHLMTEAVARLWGWPVAKQAFPEAKLLLRSSRDSGPSMDRRRDLPLLAAFGVDPADVVVMDGPTRVESLVGCAPQWHNAEPFYASPGITEVWRRIATGVTPVDHPSTERVFVTRRSGNRPCANYPEVERLFAERGFTLVDPGVLSFEQQAAAFAKARVVAGFGGTGMFNLAFSPHVEHVIVLNHRDYDARNESLFAAVRGADAHLFWSASDADPAASSYERFQSSWSFDWEACGADLRGLLDDV